MYLDANGDGYHSVGDRVNPKGTPTTVDVYLVTNRNRDGTTATCTTADGPLSMNSYVVCLRAVGGTVAYSNFINRLTTFTTAFGQVNADGINYKNGYGQQARSPG